MRYGVVFPQTEFGNDPRAIRDYAAEVERLGYDYLLVYDHVLGAHPDREPPLTGPYTWEHPFHEPFVLFGYLAGATSRLELVTGIIILPQRQTALVAKQAAEVDVLTQGRLRLGIGIGWNPVEYEALGQSFHDRGARVEEQVEVLRRLWTERLVEFEGRWHRIDRAGLNPLPVQQPIPIWFGGGADRALRRAARLGEGWLPAGRPPNEDTGRKIELLRRTLEEEGRDPGGFGIDPWISIAGLEESEWAQRMRAWRTLGATHLAVDTMRAGFRSPEEHLQAVTRFREVLGETLG